jgi:hypothetical protein
MTYKKIIAAHQPNFMPNLAFFYKMSKADLFVLVTNLQFERQEGWQRRNVFKEKNGKFMLTVPLLGSQNQMIKEVLIKKERDWVKKHKRSLKLNYGNTKEQDLLLEVERIYDNNYDRLVDLNVAFIKLISKSLGIPTPITVDEEVTGAKHKLIINICKDHGGDSYLSGSGAKRYMNDERVLELENKGIRHKFVNTANLSAFSFSALHYLLTRGKEETMRILNEPMQVAQNLRFK